jgi:predicted TIM-barrel fold metal-dependent hydrolase
MELGQVKAPVAPLPADACDAHTHIFGPASIFPYVDDRPYTPPDAPFEALRALHRKLGIGRGVIVQPGCHGYDMSAVLDALARGQGQYRAVALLPSTATSDQIRKLDAAGVRGVRFNFVAHLDNAPWSEVQAMARLIAPFGWHICIHSDQQSLPDLLPLLKQLETPFVLDHMGRVSAGNGVGSDLFRQLLALSNHDRAWIKISGVDRISSSGKRPYSDGRPFMKALIETMADRLLWGSDWPHPNVRGEMPDDGELVDILTEVCPDRSEQERILVSNPHTLYRFDNPPGNSFHDGDT